MSYTTDIPVSGDSLGGTRDRIRTNFQLISSVFGQNHLTFGQSNRGLHKYVVMPEAGTLTPPDGIPGTNANEAALYMNQGTSPAEANLFIRGESDGNHWQLTRLDNANFGRFGKASATDPNGWTFLPGGLILQYGVKLAPGSSGTILFTTDNINFPTACINVSLTQRRDGSSSNQGMYLNGIPTNLSFSYNGSSNSDNALYWWALGY